MEDLYQEQASFAGGVQPGTPVDRVPETAVASGINTAFRDIGSGLSLLGCRPGLTAVNTTALGVSVGGDPHLDFARLYTYDTGSTYTNYLAVVNRNGKLYYKNPNNTFTSELTLPAGWGYASGTKCFSAAMCPLTGPSSTTGCFSLSSRRPVNFGRSAAPPPCRGACCPPVVPSLPMSAVV